jgi:anti-sigma factor RsiW
MNHDDIKNNLSGYHDHELTADQAALVERHLDGCSECRQDLSHLQRLSAIVAPLTGIEDTEQFVQRVMARLPEPAPTFWESLQAWWRIPALAMAALLVVSMSTQKSDSTLSTGSLLCGDKVSAAVKHLCSDDAEHADELMDLVWGNS